MNDIVIRTEKIVKTYASGSNEVHALRGENFRALGMVDKAEASYAQALRLNSGNRTANDALARLQGQSQAISH